MFKSFKKFKENEKSKEEELDELLKNKPINLEKNDVLAIIIAAFTTIAPVAIIFFLIIMGIVYLFFS